jgi:2-methylcitrate dehydratase PrpD
LGDDELDPEFPDRYTTIIEVDSRGQTYKQLVRYAKGCPENPMTESELQEKYRKLAGSVIENNRVNELLEAVKTSATASPIDHLVNLLQINDQDESE